MAFHRVNFVPFFTFNFYHKVDFFDVRLSFIKTAFRNLAVFSLSCVTGWVGSYSDGSLYRLLAPCPPFTPNDGKRTRPNNVVLKVPNDKTPSQVSFFFFFFKLFACCLSVANRLHVEFRGVTDHGLRHLHVPRYNRSCCALGM
jgi:hypothetical protein